LAPLHHDGCLARWVTPPIKDNPCAASAPSLIDIEVDAGQGDANISAVVPHQQKMSAQMIAALEFRARSAEACRFRRTDGLNAEKCSDWAVRNVCRKSTELDLLLQ